MKRLIKAEAIEDDQKQELVDLLTKVDSEMFGKIENIFNDHAELIQELSMASLHTEHEKDIDVLLNDVQENFKYIRVKLNHIKEHLLLSLLLDQ